MSASTAVTDPAQWFEQTDPNRLFLRTPEGRAITYGELLALSGRQAAALASLGVRAGDRVAVQVEKSPEAFLLYLACLRLGAVYVPLNTAFTQVELEYFLGDSDPRLVIVRPQDHDSLQSLVARLGIPTLHTLGTQDDGSFAQAARRAAPDAFEPQAPDPEALASLLYTSGTTGRSKGAMITRGNLAFGAAALAECWHFSANDVLLHALPVFHIHGLFLSANTVLAAGAGMIFLPRFDADEVIRWLPQASVMMGVPTYYTRLLKHPGLATAAKNLRLFVSGSAPLLAETHRAFQEKTGHAILERYGMTETQVNTSNPYEGERRPGTVGMPLRGVELRVTALDGPGDAGREIAGPEAVGMIEIRGPNRFAGYWRNPDKTAADIRSDGWFITGDVGRVDARGYLHIVGRAKDLIISGGVNVYPIEIETEIDALPDVLESAVIGLPHADFGEGVTAAVIRRESSVITEAEILEALRSRLASFKLPKRVVFVEDFPRNALGKVQKNLLRQRFAGLYG